MKGKSLLLLTLVFVMASACKTQEDIRRDKTVETLNEQVAQTRASTASTSQRFTALEEQIARLTGQLEEANHSKAQDAKDAASLKEKLASVEEVNRKQTEFIKALSDKMNEQTKYLEQVIKTLATMSEEKKEHESSSKKKNQEQDEADGAPTVKSAVAKFKAGELEDAKDIFLKFVEGKKTKKKDKEASLYYLGMIEYKNKNFEEAKVYFSKLFTENPNSSYGAGSLLNLAKSFLQLKSKEEATQAIDELIERFPKSKEAKEGEKLKAKI